jgi:hypothetical protein
VPTNRGRRGGGVAAAHADHDAGLRQLRNQPRRLLRSAQLTPDGPFLHGLIRNTDPAERPRRAG